LVRRACYAAPFRRPFIESYRWLPARGVRFTVIDKETGAIVRRAEAAFDEDGAVVLDLLAYPDARVIDAFYLAELRAGKAIPQSLLTRFVITLGEGPVTQPVLSAAPLELPRIAYHRLAGRRHRYVWGVSPTGSGFFDSLVKQDLETRNSQAGPRKTHFPASPYSWQRQTHRPRMRVSCCQWCSTAIKNARSCLCSTRRP
jgi:beta,beta-carotene 9',10'-dioxygenase